MKWGVGLVDFSYKIDDLMAANVMNVSKPNNEERKVADDHLTLKPIKLMEHLVNLFTKKNDVVLDCFMGSGTTGVACKNLNRNFIGIELDENYYKIAKERIENA
jgi:site-specific DNA-methyltransferase (adenine-specific)